MRILVVNWRDITHPWAGGAELNVHEQAKRWVQAGHHVTLFCGAYVGCSRTAVLDGIHIVRRGGRFTVYIWAAIYYLTRFRSHYDVIVDVENGIPFFTPVYARIPKVCLFHHLHTEQYGYEFPPPLSWLGIVLESVCMPFVYRKVDFVAISESSREALQGIGVDAERCTVSYCGVDAEEYRPCGPKEGRPMFVYLGRLMAYKRVDLLIRIMARVVEVCPEAVLHIAGAGPTENWLKELTAQLALQDHIVFHGYVSPEEKAALLQQAWALVTASSKEGWGLVAIEANACGTPAIAFNVPGLCEAIVDGRTGLLAHTEVEFVQAMLRLVEDQPLREALTRNGLEHASRFDWDVTAMQMLRVLVEQVEGSGGYEAGESQTVAESLVADPISAQLRSRHSTKSHEQA